MHMRENKKICLCTVGKNQWDKAGPALPRIMVGDSLHQLDSLEEPHDFEDAKHFDGSENPLITVHDCNTVPCHTILQWTGAAQD